MKRGTRWVLSLEELPLFPATDSAWTAAFCFEERVPKHERKMHSVLVELVEVAVVKGDDLSH